MKDGLPKTIVVEYLNWMDKYRLIEPYFIWKGREFHPGLIIEKSTLDDIKAATKKS